MPASLNTLVRLAVSSAILLSIASGVSAALIRNWLLSLARISGVFSASAQSFAILSRIGLGTLLGANNPNHESYTNGSPASVKVGTFGMSGMRCAVAAAIAVTLPAADWSRARFTGAK